MYGDNRHLCGCYYIIDTGSHWGAPPKNYLPLISSSAHSTILSTISRTTLSQTFTNSTPDNIKSCIYTFPLYDGVSVVSFTCRIGSKILTGIVKEKYKAKKIFDDAVAKGETAGLLEQSVESADVFSTKLGNIPAGESIIVDISYVGELKHTETEGIRFTIPTRIAPRYGSGPGTTFQGQQKGIQITVDVNMPDGTNIKNVKSPSHPIEVSLGTLSTAKDDDASLNKASATLSLGSSALDKDFVLIVAAKDVGVPKAILESHPEIPNHRAVMATLVPKFSLPAGRPEIVFVADRSGSMASNIAMLKSAMTVFLKSIPLGVKFNICSFGSSHSFLWEKSQAYTADTLNQATSHLTTFSANMGGTETFAAVKATIDRRYGDIPLEVILLTDGDIWAQEVFFKYLNEQTESSKGQIRVFPLGIGSGVSHALIEGVARAGNGFASAVQDGERLDNSVVKMLRGALTPHITDYTLEVKYARDEDTETIVSSDDDDFELIEKVTDGLKVLLSDDAEKTKPTISLFDKTINPEKEDLQGGDPHAHLPSIPTPSLLQAPHKIPSFFAFSRTTVYILLTPDTKHRHPVAVVLKATSEHGPLELEIPIEALSKPGKTIHQLAAKKAVQDLEEGHGWLCDAKDQDDKLVKDRYPSCFQEIVEREAVRLGERFQIAGKWTSFVAVSNDENSGEKEEYKRYVQLSHKVIYADHRQVSKCRAKGQSFPVRDAKTHSSTSVKHDMVKLTPRTRSITLGEASHDVIHPEQGYGYNPTNPIYSSAIPFGGYSPASPGFSPASPSYSPVSPSYDSDVPISVARSLKPVELSPTLLSHYAKEMESAAAMPLPDEDDIFDDLSPDIQTASISPKRKRADDGDGSPTPPPQRHLFSNATGARTMASTASAPVPFEGARKSSRSGGAIGMGGTSLERGEKLESLEAKTDALAESSKEFYKSKKKLSGGFGSSIQSFSKGLFGSSSAATNDATVFQPEFASSSPPQPPTMQAQYTGFQQPQQSGFQAQQTGFQAPQAPGGSGLFSNNPFQMESIRQQHCIDDGSSSSNSQGLFGSVPAPPLAPAPISASSFGASPPSGGYRQRRASKPAKKTESAASSPTDWPSKSTIDRMHALISLQTFEGFWTASKELAAILGMPEDDLNAGKNGDVWCTLVVIKIFEDKLTDEEGTWGLVVDKAKDWLNGRNVTKDVDESAAKLVDAKWK